MVLNSSTWSDVPNWVDGSIENGFEPYSVSEGSLCAINASTGEIRIRALNNTAWGSIEDWIYSPGGSIPGGYQPLGVIGPYPYVVNAQGYVMRQSDDGSGNYTASGNDYRFTVALPAGYSPLGGYLDADATIVVKNNSTGQIKKRLMTENAYGSDLGTFPAIPAGYTYAGLGCENGTIYMYAFGPAGPVNTAPTFVGGIQSLSVNQNAIATTIKDLLHVSDPDTGQTLTWSQHTAPSHGSLGFTSATANSSGNDITPGGTITYTPTNGYSGADSFIVQVSDGSLTATRAISVTITPQGAAADFNGTITTSGSWTMKLNQMYAGASYDETNTWFNSLVPTNGGDANSASVYINGGGAGYNNNSMGFSGSSTSCDGTEDIIFKATTPGTYTFKIYSTDNVVEKTISIVVTGGNYTMTFDSEGGSAVASSTVSSGTAVATPTAPTKTGYTFGGWYDGDNGSGNVVTFPYTLTASKTVYAKWTAIPYTLTFDSEGGDPVNAVTQNYNTQVAAPTAPTKVGNVFGGWYDTDNGTGNLVSFPYTLTGDKIVYAKWTVQQNTLTFDSEGGSPVAAATQNYNTQVALPTAPTKSGYTFGGWYDGDNGTGNAVSFPHTLTANKIVYAKWTVNPYTVTYDAGAGTVSPASQTKLFGATYGKAVDGISDEAMPTPTQTGYTFGGWYTGANGTGSMVTGATAVSTALNHTLYAKWTVQQNKITFDSEGGSPVNEITQDYNTQVTAPTAPTKVGHTFGGWYDGDNGTGNVVSFPHTLTANKTVYAKWTINPYTLTFDAEGGGAVDPITQNYNTPVSAPTAPTKAGYTFDGWYDGDNGSGNLVTFPHTLLGDKMLYAKWTINPYTLTFDSEGGDVVNAITQNYNTQVTAPTAPTKVGHTFAGWYENDNGLGNEVTFPYTLTANKMVYAKWTINPYTLTFDEEGGSVVNAITQNYNTQVAAPTAPTKTGYAFGGWYESDNGTGSAVAFPHTLITHKTVYAKWTANPYTLIFDSEGGTPLNPITQDFNTQIAAQIAPTQLGYTFVGWYENDNGMGNEVTFPYTVTANKTVYAKWQINTSTVTYKNNYNAGDGSVYMTQTVLGAKGLSAPSQPLRSGFVFEGWYSNNTCTNAWNFKTNVVSTDTTLYAKWSVAPVVKYTVQYAANGATSGSVPVDLNAYEAGATVRVSGNVGSLAKSGHTFGGWSHGGTTYTAGQTISVASDVTLTAVWTAVPTTYTATYDMNNGTNAVHTTQAGVLAGATLTAPADPVRAGYTFIGWYKEAACINLWNFDAEPMKANTRLYAKWASAVRTASGQVVDDQGTPVNVSGATVKVVQGNSQFGSTETTNAGGNFTVTSVPDGTYNIVVTKGNQEVTVFFTISGGNYVFASPVVLPTGNKNSTIDIVGTDTPNVVVDLLNTIFNDGTVFKPADQTTVTNGGTVEIKLTVQKNDHSANKTTVEAAMTSGGYTSGTILDIDLTKTATTSGGSSETTAIASTGNLIKLIIPLPAELQGKSTYVIYRAHDYGSGVVADAITTAANANGEYLVVSGDKTQITAYLKYFSTYAIAYSNGGSSPSTPSTPPSGGGSSGGGGGGAAVVAPVVVPPVAPVKPLGIPYYMDDKGNIVFIGFASNINGTMKYLAPKGKVVQFKGNPKNFADVEGHWAQSDIEFVTERELFSGTGNGTFSPKDGMSRGMLATVIGRLYEGSYGKIEDTKGAKVFKDVDYTDYYGKYVDWAAEKGIIVGVGQSKFEPQRMVTREEMAVILYHFAKTLNLETGNVQSGTGAYADAAAISAWAKEAATYCQQSGVMSGREGGKFAPQDVTTRAEVAVILEKFVENAVK